MGFALIARTRGDELIQSETKVVAISDDREELVKLKNARTKEREDWLAVNQLPWWAECGIISEEEITEVATV